MSAVATEKESQFSGWKQVWRMNTIPKTALLMPQNIPPIQKLRKLSALKIHTPARNVFTIDFGQNTAGTIAMKIPSGLPAGANVTIFFAEILTHPPYTATANGYLMRQNLRSAIARDIYIASGKESAGTEWEPTFSQHGFRYIQIYGLSKAPILGDFVVC